MSEWMERPAIAVDKALSLLDIIKSFPARTLSFTAARSASRALGAPDPHHCVHE